MHVLKENIHLSYFYTYRILNMVNIKDLFQKGYKYHQSGNLAAAVTLYLKILDEQPAHTDTIFLTGTLYLQQGNFDAAAVFLKKAISLKPNYVTAYNNLGAAQQLQGKFDEAIDSYRQAIKLKPDDAQVYKNLGNALKEKGILDEAISSYRQATFLNPNDAEAYNDLGATLQKSDKLDEAIESHRQAIRLKPDYAMAYDNLGSALKKQGKLDEAIAGYRQALSLKPDYAEAHNNLGTTLQEQGRLDEAIACYRQALLLKPDYAEANYNLGNALKILGKIDEAIKSYKQAITLKQNYTNAYVNLGTALQEHGKFNEAIASYRQALSFKPDYVEAHNNLGNALKEQGKLDEAIASYRQALSFKPDHAEAHNNLGATLQEQGKLAEAIASYDRAIVLKSDYVEAHINKSFALLLTENFEQGWQEYEWRLRAKNRFYPVLKQPRWDGSPLNGRSILVHAEQGLGDIIQFIRYLPLVHAQASYVIFKCQQDLFRLLQNCKGFDEIMEQTPSSKSAVQFDVHIPLLSLPGIFGTTLDSMPSNSSYITADPKLVTQWQMRIGHNEDFKIGIVWAGNPKNRWGRKRSCSLAYFAPLADTPGLTFYSLQKGPASTEAFNPPKNMKLINLENELNDFTDTAAIIANLDLVISVDTAVAHLTGSLGKPLWNLLYFSPDWRWLQNRDDSPWYPSMRLFRQTRPNDWVGVFEQVKKALNSHLLLEVNQL
jgi:tetratricopeptide (TPR) repeat protein